MLKLNMEYTLKQRIISELEEKGIEYFVEYLLKKFKSSSTVSPSGNQLFVNPCPLCGHNDCFNIFSQTGLFNCFSCRGSGNATDLPMLFTKDIQEGSQALQEFSGISIFLNAENKEQQRKKDIYADVTRIYHKQLLENTDAINYLIQVRKRQIETIEKMQTGFCTSRADIFSQLKELGYNDDEIKKMLVPQGIFVYPYSDRYGVIQRFNTKNYLKATISGSDGTRKVIEGYSIGKRKLLFNPNQKYAYAIVVEGEQDFAAIIENGDGNVIAMGGSPSADQINELRQFKKLYLCFDSDEAGKAFTQKVNNTLPDVKIYSIEIPHGYKDIDEYYTSYSNPVPVQSLLDSSQELINTESHGSVINNKVMLKNRDWQIEFDLTQLDIAKQMYKGNLKNTVNGKIVDNKNSIFLPNGIPKQLLEYADKLSQAIDEHYNCNFNKKNLFELSDIFYFSYNKPDIIKAATTQLIAIEDKKERDACIASLTDKSFRNSVVREIIATENEMLKDQAVHYPLIKPGQAYIISEENPVAYIYFNKSEDDGKGNLIEMPCLLSSDKRIITLTDYSKVSPNQIVIVDGRFRLRDVIKGPLLSTDFCSLKQGYAKRYIEGEIEQEYLKPEYIIRKFEELFAKVYYNPDSNIYKVLALYAYATYYADLFGVLPYLYLTAQKGCGKSTILALLSKLCFNSVFVTDVTTASFIRISNLCATLIVDEFEGHSSRSKNQEDDLTPLIKSGYSKSSGGAIRTNQDETYKIDYYDAFSPKVFAAIGELDDVLRDRSLTVILQKYNAKQIYDVISISEFKMLYGEEMVKCSSFAALSALDNFQTVYKNYMKTETESESARANEIMKPLYTLAKMVGKDYIDAIKAYNISNEKSKEYVDGQSVEGVIKEALSMIALSSLDSHNFQRDGIVPKIMYYENGDCYIDKESTFKFDTFLLKTISYDGNYVYLNTFILMLMARQLHDFGSISLKQVHNALPRLNPNEPILKQKRTTVSFSDVLLTQEFKRGAVTCNKIAINIADYGVDKIRDDMELQRDRKRIDDEIKLQRDREELGIENITEDELMF
jgi:hypothetical protein